MNPTMSWEGPETQSQKIAGDRRYERRYDIQLDTRWKLVRRRKVMEAGVGRTIDLSSSGILFDAGRTLPVGLNIELSVSWPVLLHNVAPLQLVVLGRIVRADNTRLAVRMIQHEFRTMPHSADQRKPPLGAHASSSYLSNVTAMSRLVKPQ
jgi:hypothetical protein